MNKLQITTGGQLITIADFQTMDGFFDNPDFCDKIEVLPDGTIVGAYFGGMSKVWETVKPGSGEIFVRPSIKTEPEYFLELIDDARSTNQPDKIIKSLINWYELALKQERRTNVPDDQRTVHVAKVWNY